MAEEFITKSEAQVLIDARIKEHDEAINEPKHEANQAVIKEVTQEVRALRLDITEMKATQSIVMKFAGAGILVWSIRQIIELVQSFHH